MIASAGARLVLGETGWLFFVDLIRISVLLFGFLNLYLMAWLLIGSDSTWRTRLRVSGLVSNALATLVCMYTEFDQRGKSVGTGGRLWIVVGFITVETYFIIQAHKV